MTQIRLLGFDLRPVSRPPLTDRVTMRRGRSVVKGTPIRVNAAPSRADRAGMDTPAWILAGALLATVPLAAPHPAASTQSVADVPGRLAPSAIRVELASAQ